MKYRGGYQHEEWGLVRKTKPVLDILLSIVREKRIEPPELLEVLSESDDDY